MDLKVARRLIRSPRSQGLHTGDGAFIDVEIDFRLFPVKVGDSPLTLDDDDGLFDICPSWADFRLCTGSLEEGVPAELVGVEGNLEWKSLPMAFSKRFSASSVISAAAISDTCPTNSQELYVTILSQFQNTSSPFIFNLQIPRLERQAEFSYSCFCF